MYAADFETTTDPNDCRVWAYALCEIGNEENIILGNSIDDFIEWCDKKGNNSTIYFHNLKFDGAFIIDYLLKHGYQHTDRENKGDKTFNTLIGDTGQFYKIEIIFKKYATRYRKIVFQDSLKILPMKVSAIAKTFNLEFQKLELDYKAYREVGHKLTAEEERYIKHDVIIVAKALHFMFEQGMTKMTTAANALNEYKKTIGAANFKTWFPPPYYDDDIRHSYKGGFTYASPNWKDKEVGEGIVLDVNSLYPSVMYKEKLPYGEGMYFEGRYEEDDLYDLYIQIFRCNFRIKKDHIPSIQLKHSSFFVPTEYVEEAMDVDATLCLTSVDLKLFYEQYDVFNEEWFCGWKFMSANGMFTDYIDKWSEEKIKAKEEGNGGMYALSKLMLNSLYGKFATSPVAYSQIPFLNEKGVVAYKLSEPMEKKPIYIPVASFITAYARYKTISSAQKVYHRFMYADTDSMHLIGKEIPLELDISETELGAWKIESEFTRGKYLRAKTYIEDNNPPETWGTDKYDKKLLNITCAGMPESCYQYVTFENFQRGASFGGKLLPSRVNGGVVLMEHEFTIKL